MNATNREGNPTSSTNTIENEWQLLEALEAQPETSQADLAAQAGVAVGTVNWYLKKWAAKGYVKIKRIDRWHWSYLLTPQGISRKATLAKEYVAYSMTLYRRTREASKRLLDEVRNLGYEQVVIDGDGEIADICRLTCLEMGIQVGTSRESHAPEIPLISIDGVELTLHNTQNTSP
ncbi:MAG: winged helix-turn-helix transcriptional regulator [Chloroflexota bacterium]